MTAPQIMAFVGTGHVGAMPDSGVLPAWQCNQLYFITPGSDPNASGVRQFEAYPTGNPLLERTIGEIGLPAIAATAIAAALSSGEYLVGNEFSSNSTTLFELYGLSLSSVTYFGVSGSSLSPSTAKRILTSGSMAPLRINGADYIITCPLVSGFAECCQMLLPSMSNVNLGAITENRGFCGRGKATQSPADGIGGGWVLGVGGTTTLGLYHVTSGAMVSVGKVTAASIDPAWTTITGASGVAYDQVDGNPIIAAFSTAAANPYYIVKLNASTAAVMWAVQVNAPAASADMANATITRQVFYFMGASNTLYTLNTAAGTATSAVIGSLTLTGGQISEDIWGSIVMEGSWVETTTHPTYGGTYMGTQGNHVINTTWLRWLPGGPISPSPVTCILPQPGAVSINRSWSYVQDGHTFYVLDLGSQGTFAFDTVTQQWCELQTNGTNFALTNGVMWGQRVVGGDPSSTDVWELDPGATMDSAGLYNVSHVVTGGLATRSRTFVSCSALRVSASFGLVGTSGATFNMRFSDDQGQTWSSYFQLTLTAGDFDSEIAWRSLGSFCSPGRIFELSDSGGLIRIDGCDAFLDGFDNEGQGGADGG